MNRTRFILAGLLIALVALIPAGPSFAKEIVQVTITDPDLANELDITDAETLATIQPIMEGIPGKQPAEMDTDYFEVRLAIGDGKDVVATIVYHYFPGINADHGYMYYAEFIGGTSSAQGDWYQLSDTLDHDLRSLLREAGVRFGVASTSCDATEQAPTA